MRLKRWESPRREGRNDKGKGGSARQRQIKKQFKMLSKKLKDGESRENREDNTSLFYRVHNFNFICRHFSNHPLKALSSRWGV
ncbi:MAG: hypothetical protein N5P05_001847 [Chroococcopsis gigantea SAG 12.99]|nr:hypothetical protein [Chroococcopsis gigantea SAG 12.99]